MRFSQTSNIFRRSSFFAAAQVEYSRGSLPWYSYTGMTVYGPVFFPVDHWMGFSKAFNNLNIVTVWISVPSPAFFPIWNEFLLQVAPFNHQHALGFQFSHAGSFEFLYSRILSTSSILPVDLIALRIEFFCGSNICLDPHQGTDEEDELPLSNIQFFGMVYVSRKSQDLW